MPRLPTLAVLLFILAACSGTPVASLTSGDELVIRSGTSFGMCIGYCRTEIRISPREIVFIETSRDTRQHPTRTRRSRIDAKEWQELVALADTKVFSGLKEYYGCPDCADGGAEWIELERQEKAQRVTFEHGKTVPGIEPLIEKIRAVRARFRP